MSHSPLRKAIQTTPRQKRKTTKSSLLEGFSQEYSDEDDEFSINRRFDSASTPVQNKENQTNNSVYSIGRKQNNLHKFMADLPVTKQRTPLAKRTRKQLRAQNTIQSVAINNQSDEDLYDEDIDEAEVLDDEEDILIQNPYDRLFEDLKIKKNSTSNNTLSQLPSLSQQEYAETLARIPQKHVLEKKNLRDRLRLYFPQWLMEFDYNFNIVTYGYGSKRNILEEFAKTELNDIPVVIINGYFPTITLKIILECILEQIGHNGPSGNDYDKLHIIETYFKASSTKPAVDKLALVIHNIDGQNLRTERTQSILASLSSLSRINLICSIDHINSPLMWSTQLLEKFNFIWHDLTTFDNYDIEMSFENRLLTSRNQIGASGAIHVLSTLNSNANQLFNILLTHQITQKSGMPYNNFLRLAMESFVTTSESAFKTHLTEFKDHRLILSKEVDKGVSLYIPFDEATLEDLASRLEDNGRQ